MYAVGRYYTYLTRLNKTDAFPRPARLRFPYSSSDGSNSGIRRIICDKPPDVGTDRKGPPDAEPCSFSSHTASLAVNSSPTSYIRSNPSLMFLRLSFRRFVVPSELKPCPSCSSVHYPTRMWAIQIHPIKVPALLESAGVD